MIKSSRLRWTGHVARMEDCMNAFKILIGKPTGNRLVRSRSRWNDDIRMDIKDIGINRRSSIHSTQNSNFWRAIVNATLKFRVP